MGGGTWRWSWVKRKIGFPCAFISGELSPPQNPTFILNSVVSRSPIILESVNGEELCGFPAKQNLCAICLENLLFNEANSNELKIFTAPCSHPFHLACIASNIRHGSTSCPICRAPWTNLPRDLLIASRPHLPLKSPSTDPILRILDESITTSRINRRSSLRSTRYNDDDPTEPHNSTSFGPHTRLLLSFLRSSAPSPPNLLLLRLVPQPPTDLIVVTTLNTSHLRQLKQAIALIVFSLRPTDRLALVTFSSSTATRSFALRRMSPNGKRAALQVIDRLSLVGFADPTEGLQKAKRILEDRAHRNPISHILHLSDAIPIARISEHHVSRFHIGSSSMREFEGFLARVMGEEIRDLELGIGKGVRVRVSDLRCGEERKILVDLRGDDENVDVRYEYKEGGSEEKIVRGEMVVRIGEKQEDRGGEDEMGLIGPRRSCVEGWAYLDPFMSTRWAKHLQGCRP